MKHAAASVVAVVLAGVVGGAGAQEAPNHVPGADEWRRAARAGTPLAVRVAGRDVRFRMEVNEELSAAEFRGLDGARVSPGVLALQGSVPGEPQSWARVTVQGDLVSGMFASPATGTISLAPARDGSTRALTSSDVGALVKAAGVPTIIEPEGQAEFAQSCSSLDWTPEFASPVELVTGTSLRTFEVAFSVDEAFVKKHPADWHGKALSFVNVIDELFRRSFDVSLHVVHLIAIPDSVLSATTTSALLVQLQDYYVANWGGLARENAHLFTAKDTTNAAGQVNCVGSAGRTTVSYSVGKTDGGPYTFGPLVLLPDIATKVGAHELAHTLSDHHHYSNCVESLPTYDPIHTTDACTVMINDWGLINMTFSAVDRLAVRGWVKKYNL